MNDETSVIRTVGRYRALSEIGRGAMGVVFRAFDPVIGRTIALKTIALGAGDVESTTLRERLYREASAAGVLAHPNIVTVYDVIEDGSTVAVAMEFVEGQTLASLIAARGALPTDRALDLFERICAALDYAGAQGIVHRDIKPANILLTADNRVKVTDFGIARLTAGGVTQTSTIMGSPSYMSPEQVRGLPLDRRSDLFSAAVILYEMLAGERPFAGDDIATTMYRIVNEPPRAVEQFNPTIGAGISAVLHRALAKNPIDRYQTGAELVGELRRAHGVGSQPIGTMPIAAPVAQKKKRSALVVIGIPGAVVVLLLVVLIVIGSSPDTGKQSAAPEQTPSAVAPTITAPVTTPVEPAPPVTIPESTPPPAPTPGPLSTVPPPERREPAAAASPADTPKPRPAPTPRAEKPQPSAPATRTEPAEAPSSRSAPQAATPREEPAPPPAAPRPAAAASLATLVVAYEGPAYPVTLTAGDTSIGRLEGPGDTVTIDPGAVRLRATNDALFLNADLGTITVRAGERRTVRMPPLASAVLSVRGEEYAGVRIAINGRQLPGPYPAQIARIAAGTHQVTYRWTTGASAGREVSSTITIGSPGHFLIRAGLDNDQVVIQQLR